MSDYSAFFLMKPEDVKRYAVEVLHFFQPDEETDCVEIGDGNINYVFQVRSRKAGRSVIVKQADKLLRSSGRPLDLYRNKIEAETLMLEARLAPKFIPEVYHYDETMAALSMEDISAYKNLRKELAAGRVYGHLSENLSDFLAQSLLPTTDLVMDRQEKKKQVKFFTNPELCDITEDLVLTEPYLAQPMNPRNKNIVTPGNEDFVRTRLYEDEALHGEVAALRNGFMNNAQALIHGDLHSGSIFANEQGIKVIDPEFAFYGPMGYDIGNVIGNLFFAWANKAYTGGSAETQTALAQTIRETCDKTAEKLAAVQRRAERGEESALTVLRDIGVYLGHTLPLYAAVYDLQNLLVLGRVASGVGGEQIVSACRRVLAEEYPSLEISVTLPDERFRRVGQSMAAASLPEVE